MQRKIAIIVVAILVLGAGVYFLMQQSSKTSTGSSSTSTSQASTSSTDTKEAQAAATITYTDSGFSPESITVKSGQTVAIKNDSSADVQFDSDPHPVHTTNEELNVEIIASGQTKTFTVTKTGTFGYHNHLNPAQEGTIVVE